MNNEKDECEVQFFGFSIEQMKLERRLFIKHCITSNLEHLQKSILKKSDISDETGKQIVSKLKARSIETNIFDKLEDNLKKMETFDKKYFTIPSNVSMYGERNEYRPEDEQYLKDVCDEMQEHFTQHSIMISAVENEISQFNEIEDVILQEQEAVKRLKESFKVINLDKCNTLIAEVENTIDMSEAI